MHPASECQELQDHPLIRILTKWNLSEMNIEAANCANDVITALSQHALWPLEPSHLLPLTDTERKQKHAELLE